MTIRLVATDLDGTLLRDDLSIAPRTRAALDALRDAGIIVVPVTARQKLGVRTIAAEAGFTDWALCSNGSFGVNLRTGNVLFEAHLDVPTQRELAARVLQAAPGTLFVSIRDGGEQFIAQAGYSALAQFEDHKRDPADMGQYSLGEVLAEPSLKLVLRHPELDARRLLDLMAMIDLDGFEVTHSGAPFVEVLADGVSKAWGLAKLCEHLDIAQHEVLAFGDARNDVEMLAWAGRGVAVANACAESLAVADEITASNEQDGVAIVIEQLLATPEATNLDAQMAVG